MEKEEEMKTTETDEDLLKMKLMDMCESKPSRPSDDAMFLRTEIISAIKISDEKVKRMKVWTVFDKQSRTQSKKSWIQSEHNDTGCTQPLKK